MRWPINLLKESPTKSCSIQKLIEAQSMLGAIKELECIFHNPVCYDVLVAVDLWMELGKGAFAQKYKFGLSFPHITEPILHGSFNSYSITHCKN